MKVIAKNKKAFHDYNIEDKFEAGIVLTGTEIKSIRAKPVQLRESFAFIRDGEVYLNNMHISPVQTGELRGFEERRPRKLLLHKREINHLIGKIKEKGYTLMPLSLYFKNHRVKVELGLGKGKKLFDKRRTMAEKTAKREIERELKKRR